MNRIGESLGREMGRRAPRSLAEGSWRKPMAFAESSPRKARLPLARVHVPGREPVKLFCTSPRSANVLLGGSSGGLSAGSSGERGEAWMGGKGDERGAEGAVADSPERN